MLTLLLAGTALAGPLTIQQGDYGNNSAPEAGDAFGASAAIGDFDCDGRADLAVGSPGEDYGGKTDIGIVSVHAFRSGAPSGSPEILFQSGSSSPESGDQFGGALATGDFDGDGCSDLAVAAINEDWGSVATAGVISIYHGDKLGMQYDTMLTESNVGSGVQAYGRFGAALAVGDFDGDGYDDLAIGEYNDNGNAGEVHVVYGSASGLSTASAVSFTQADTGAGADESEDLYGSALAVGDFDDDGYDDLAIGAPGEQVGSGPVSSGYVSVLFSDASGVSSTADQSFSYNAMGTASGDELFGHTLAAGDVDGDGADDLLVSAPGADSEAGEVGIFLSDGTDLDTNNPDVITNVISSFTSGLGSALAVGDLDQDGDDDIAITYAVYDYPAAGDGLVMVHESDNGAYPTMNSVIASDAGFSGGTNVGSDLAIGNLQRTGSLDLVVGMSGADSATGAVHLDQPL